jgi:hypothetical protein
LSVQLWFSARFCRKENSKYFYSQVVVQITVRKSKMSLVTFLFLNGLFSNLDTTTLRTWFFFLNFYDYLDTAIHPTRRLLRPNLLWLSLINDLVILSAKITNAVWFWHDFCYGCSFFVWIECLYPWVNLPERQCFKKAIRTLT